MLAKNTFINELVQKTMTNPIWHCPEKNKQHRAKKRITKPEPLIETYNLTNWMNPFYKDRGPMELKCTPLNINDSYRGLLRK